MGADFIGEKRGFLRRAVQNADAGASGVREMEDERAHDAAAAEDADVRAFQRESEDLLHGAFQPGRWIILGRKAMANVDSILNSRDITLPTKVHLVKAMVFHVPRLLPGTLGNLPGCL